MKARAGEAPPEAPAGAAPRHATLRRARRRRRRHGNPLLDGAEARRGDSRAPSSAVGGGPRRKRRLRGPGPRRQRQCAGAPVARAVARRGVMYARPTLDWRSGERFQPIGTSQVFEGGAGCWSPGSSRKFARNSNLKTLRPLRRTLRSFWFSVFYLLLFHCIFLLIYIFYFIVF